MRKFNRKLSSVLVALTALGISVHEVQAKDSDKYGPAIDAFCIDANGSTPFADAPPALGQPGCGLCHAPSFVKEPEWTWWRQGDSSGDFSPFCPSTPVNTSPMANAGPDQTVTEGDTVTLNAGGSSDADGDPLTYQWTLTVKPAGSTAALSDPNTVTPSFVAEVDGEYQAQLIVNDGTEDSAPDTVVINTQPGNTAPVANAGPDQSGTVGDTITLNAGGSSDVDGDNLTYQWSLVSKPAGSSAALSDPSAVSPTFVADVEGEYVAQLVVNDGTVDSVVDSVTVTTQVGNTAPVANAGVDQTVVAGDTVALDASGSSDVNGDALTYQWSLISTPSGSSAALSDPTAVAPEFVADVEGEYVVQLQVNDGQLDSLPDTVTITTASGNSAPVADAGADQAVLIGDTVMLDASNSSDADGDALSYQWSLITRPAGSAAALSDAATAMPSFIADVEGEYVVQVVVNDGQQDSAPDTVVITTAPGNIA
ncbi:MAG: PKD domain-containing protein, partial [Chromatiales bacterium]|nr:PKD domain-containing protein [Chromatiales bacterium]